MTVGELISDLMGFDMDEIVYLDNGYMESVFDAYRCWIREDGGMLRPVNPGEADGCCFRAIVIG